MKIVCSENIFKIFFLGEVKITLKYLVEIYIYLIEYDRNIY